MGKPFTEKQYIVHGLACCIRLFPDPDAENRDGVVVQFQEKDEDEWSNALFIETEMLLLMADALKAIAADLEPGT